MTELSNVCTFLYFGYLPEYSPDQLDFLGNWQEWTKRKAFLSEQPQSVLIQEGIGILKRIFRETLAGDNSKYHVLPLSGGLDSRAILGGMLENLESRQIQTVTYGSPGTYDYEIGQSVAKTVGVRFDSINLSAESWRWNAAEIMETALQVERPTWLFDAYINHHIAKQYGDDCIYWSGFMGDPLAGSHLLAKDSKTWEQAKTEFIKRNRFARSLILIPSGFIPEDCLPALPFVNADLLSYDEQLDFGIRQRCLIKHIVLPPGYACRKPFLHPEWTTFILNVPRHYREKQWLYKEILKAAYPQLFSLPTKTNVGLPLSAPLWHKAIQVGAMWARLVGERILPWIHWGINRSTNYVDFNQELRECDELKAVVYEHVQALKKRGIVDWIDIDSIWRQHQRNRGNYADALMLLASLEMYTVTGKITV
jgi:asparagine synthetase B (glutamine-hydrolysing)